MKKVLCLFIFSLISLFAAETALAENIDKLVAFGDSLSDNGNMFRYSKALHDVKDNFPIVPDAPYVSGHFTNGVTWTEYLFNKLRQKHYGLKLQNYAVGGAMVSEKVFRERLGLDFDSSTWPVHFLSHEVIHYFDDQSALSHDTKRSEHLYLFWIGANDYLSRFMPPLEIKSFDSEELTNSVVEGIGNFLDDLIDRAGAKHLVVINLPDLGKTPFGMLMGTKISSQLTDLTISHNQKLQARISQLQVKYPAVDLISIDMNQAFTTILNTHYWHGAEIAETVLPCYFDTTPKSDKHLGLVSLPKESILHHFPGNSFTLGKERICSNPNSYLFWDFIHPTTRIHQLIADEVYDQLVAHDMS